MSGPSTYNPKSGFERWLDSRLPLPRLMHDTMSTFPTPRNLNIWYTFGGILTFMLAIQIVTAPSGTETPVGVDGLVDRAKCRRSVVTFPFIVGGHSSW